MTAATVTDKVYEKNMPAIPGMEVVVLTASDTNTYTAVTLSTVKAVQATLMEDTTTLSIPISCDVTGATVTINCTGLSTKKVCLTCYGV